MNKVLDSSWRSLLVAAGYAAALVAGGMLVALVGLSLPAVEDAAASLVWSFAGGIIAGLCLGPIAASMPASSRRHLLVWGSVIFLNIASVAIEGRFFAPELIGDSLPGLFLQQLLASLTAGWLITSLFAARGAAAPAARTSRPAFSWAWRFLLSALSYVVFYFFFGGINYALVTKPYYESHAGGLAVPSPDVVLAAELVRGLLIALSVLPFLLTMRGGKKRLAVLTGLILFAIGGLVPLTMQVGTLPFILLAASAVEIFFQNFSVGVVTARLLGQSE